MNSQKKKYNKRKKYKKTNSRNENANTDSTSKLCSFSSVDYIVLASTLAIALGEELSGDDINILASFFAVLSDELALIASIDACNSGDDNTSVFVPPVPDVALTTSKKNINKKNIKKKK